MLNVDEKEIANIIFESISDGVFTVDQNCRITSFNRAAEAISGFERQEAIGRFCFDIFHSDICRQHCALRNTLANGSPVYNVRVTIITRDGRKVPINVSTTILKSDGGENLGAVEFFRDMSTIENLLDEVNKVKELGKMVSNNDAMKKIFSFLPQIAESECNVLIQGPSGSGKELVAEAIHNLSPRKNNRYIKINCAALPENLLESELFGYVKGAFTDAKRDKPGMFFLAQGGSLLLDEIGEMPVSLQSKLLRVLNDGEFQPLGATRPFRTDARIIASTNADIERKIRQGEFREDLYYRLNIINISIPPLKNRLEDIPLLVDHFVKKMQRKMKKSISSVSPTVLQVLRKYDFPGNVRELENAIEHAFVISPGGQLELNHLPQRILDATMNMHSVLLPAFSPSSEEAILRDSLKRNHWNKTLAAQELGMHRTTLWRKVKKFSILAHKVSRNG